MGNRKTQYPCPVCGFLMDYPAEDFNICPSCGVEFGAETSVFSYEVLRQNWVNHGAKWSSFFRPIPYGWDGLLQLLNAGFSDFVFPNAPTFQEVDADISGTEIDEPVAIG
jgi:hypothetical protein